MIQNNLIGILEQSWDLLAESKDPQMLPSMKFLHERLEKPQSFVSMVGETSSGKSTLVNSFLEKKFLPAKARPTTGTVTCIEYGLSEHENYYAINRDATFEELSRDKFLILAEHPDKKLLRLKAEIPGEKQKFKGLTIFDTPGFNSIIAEHEEVLKEFLPESDVIIFPVSYRVGFGMNDQELMTLIFEISEKFGSIPVLLVINRVPEGIDETNNRIKEIVSHAQDSLHRKLKYLLIRSALPDSGGNSVLPNAANLWNLVASYAFSQERCLQIAQKTKSLVISLLKQRIQEIDGELAAIAAGRSAIDALLAEKAEFDHKAGMSYAIIDKTMAQLQRELPRQINYTASLIMTRVKTEIEDSSKWVDMGACNAFVSGHLIPFGTRQAAKSIEKYISDVTDRMDQELSEVANTSIQHLNNEAQTIENPEIQKVMLNLAGRCITRLTGEAATSALRGLGGACGVSAGVGNLAKTVVKRIGNFFGKTFSKEVYKSIGKIFTKRVVTAMGAALQVLIEIGDYVWEASTWKNKYLGKISDVISKWEKEIINACETKMIPEFKKENYKNVAEVYDGLKGVVDDLIQEASQEHSSDDIQLLQNKKITLQNLLSSLEE